MTTRTCFETLVAEDTSGRGGSIGALPGASKRIEDTGSLLIFDTPDQFAAQIKAKFQRYEQVADKPKLRLD
jgi:hypothetical protein